MKEFPETDCSVLEGLRGKEATPVQQLADELGVDQSLIMASALRLRDEGLIEILEEPTRVFRLGRTGADLGEKGFPERHALETVQKAGGEVQIRKLADLLAIQEARVREVVRWLLKKKWMEKKGELLTLTPEGERALSQKGEDERLLLTLQRLGRCDEEKLQTEGINSEEALVLLKGRPHAVETKTRVLRRLRLTDSGKNVIAKGVQPTREVTQLTHELLISGKWREVVFKKYDVQLPTSPVHPGKPHPLRRIIDEARKAFLEMGFKEISSPYIESCFWDFDALFQPQDHPAREMQDTCYTLSPREAKLPPPEVVDAVGATHEDGAETGSTGWGYEWDEAKARRTVLRTHTTATTIRYLAQHPDPPQKVFCVGRVFRREKPTFKSLPEFTHLDGIVIDERATLATLFGALTEFYRKLGLKTLRFKPDYFPYTEPSAEVSFWLEERGEWMELGGSGIFRPEVTLPFGCQVPVLAWGLGVERLAMVRYGVDDIRDLYWSSVDWLREAELCR